MSDVIFAGGMSAIASVSEIARGLGKRAERIKCDLSYNDILASLREAQEESNGSSVAEMKSTADMTMDEYKEYIKEKVESFPFHPTRLNDEEIIKFSDKCWERMKSDSEYEDKMTNMIKDGRQVADPFFGFGSSGTYWVLEFDGGEGCYSHGWSKNFGGSASGARKRFEDAAKEDSFTIRAKKAKLKKEMDERYYKKQEAIKEINEQIATMRAINRRNATHIGDAIDMPITGVPASFLLEGLCGNTGGLNMNI